MLSDANKESSLNQLVGAAFGAAGQRCMALSTAIFVGEAQKWIPDLVERTQKLIVNAGTAICYRDTIEKRCVAFIYSSLISLLLRIQWIQYNVRPLQKNL